MKNHRLIALIIGTIGFPMLAAAALNNPLLYFQGGTGTTTATSGQLIYSGPAAYQNVATTSVTCSGNTSCTSFTAIGGSPITISSSGSSGTVTQINTTWPILGGPITTTGTITFGGLSTSTAAVISNIPYFSGVNTFANVATTSTAFSGPFTISGTLGAYVGGANSTITWSGLATTSQPASSNLLVSNGGAGVYGVATSTLSATSPLTGSFTQLGSGGALGCQTASGSQAGCLSAADWSTFNAKQAGGFQIGTTSSIAISQLAYSTNTGTIIGGVATSSISVSAGLTNTGTLGAQVGGTALTLKQIENRSFTASSTAAFVGTTTIALEVGYGEVWSNIKCFTDVGTVNVQIGYGTASTTMFNASTTIGTITTASNNTMTSGNKVMVDIGTPASSPTKLTCTVNDTN